MGLCVLALMAQIHEDRGGGCDQGKIEECPCTLQTIPVGMYGEPMLPFSKIACISASVFADPNVYRQWFSS